MKHGKRKEYLANHVLCATTQKGLRRADSLDAEGEE